MKPRSWLILLIGILAGVGLGLAILYGLRDVNRNATLNIGAMAPEFNLKDVDGNEQTLSQLRGKPVAVNFWATYCIPCKDEMPLLESYFRQNKNHMALVGINAEESHAQVLGFVKEYQITFPVLLDLKGEVGGLYSVRAYPSTIFINAEGKVAAIHIGVLNSMSLDNYMKTAGMQP